MRRYHRQWIFPAIGEEGQRRLLASRVAVVGCGATGSVIASLLARAGVGSLRLFDRDLVEETNLQRQILYTEADVGEPKAVAAQRYLNAVNGEIEIEGSVRDLHAENIASEIAGCDLVMDGTDNYETRYLINDAALAAGIPWIYTGAVVSYGTTLTILPKTTPCLSCVFPEPPEPGSGETCDTAGVLAPAVTAIAAIAAAEAIKILTGNVDALHGRLIHLDLWSFRVTSIRVARDPACPACKGEYRHLEAPSPAVRQLCGRNAVQLRCALKGSPSLPALARRLRAAGISVSEHPFLLRFCVEGHTLTLFPDGRALVEGTTDPRRARALYDRYIGG